MPRRMNRRTTAIGAGVATLLATALTLSTTEAGADPSATPVPDPGQLSLSSAQRIAGGLSDDLGDRSAGWYYDSGAQRLVVNVLDRDAATAVRAQGAEARMVPHSLADLDAAKRTLSDRAAIPGTAWSSDPRVNKVVVTADSTVTGTKLGKLRTVAAGLGGKVAIKRMKGELKPVLSGGDAIYGGGYRCSLGFNVLRSGQPYFLTAGHCAELADSWSSSPNGPAVGATEGSSFPGNDFGLVRYTADVPHPSEVNLYNGRSQDITEAGDASVGQRVKRSGSTTEVHSGTVTGLNATVNYQEGTVTGLIRTNVCAEPGDSGGPLFADSTALGLTSGGSGDCRSGGETYFQPVTEALAAYGAEIG
ncbi:S1 family peptidase [Streptomyces meridianus]|uniref:S1 family peptidase n=1 Tax=Streptomyces meridianus TaxID=2938945 RepID=A0ABT0XBW8_9ACTN|nr:S1 family peptidase [Streptomyces meridianus]MCM2580012.1 S1 family peptidase [Streptomyces meridianus]